MCCGNLIEPDLVGVYKRQVIRPKTLAIESVTTLLRMIAGLETPDDGEIRLDGTCGFSKERKIDLPPEERNLGFVFQDFAL